MKFTVNSETLKKTLTELLPVIGSNSVLPILDCFLFDISNDSLKVTVSDLETFATETVSVNSDITDSFAIPARILTETLKQLPNQMLTFEVSDNSVTVETLSGSYSIATESGSDYPKLPDVQESVSIEFNTDKLLTGIEKTLYALSTDTLRPALTGVCLDVKSDSVSFVATDAHRLSIVQFPDNTGITGQYIFPKKCLQVLKNSIKAENIKINFSDNNVFFTFDNTSIISRMIDARYPNYEAVIPSGFTRTAEVNRTELINSLKRVANFAEKTTNQVRIDFANGLMSITAQSMETSNKAKEKIKCDLSGSDLAMGFNVKFLIEALQNLSGQYVKIDIVSESKAAIITDGTEAKMLVMPIILN